VAGALSPLASVPHGGIMEPYDLHACVCARRTSVVETLLYPLAAEVGVMGGWYLTCGQAGCERQ